MLGVLGGFVSGVEVSRRLCGEAVRPLFSRYWPGLVYSAALLGTGSEVLGFDTARSTDHDWGPRLQLFLRAEDLAEHAGAISDLLAERLPATVAGYSTNLVPVGEPGTRHMRPADGPVRHGIVIAEPGDWLTGHLGFNPLSDITTDDWLSTSTQALAEVTGGAVFHDGLGCLHAARRALAWYPDDLWRYVLACQWQRIGQEESFVGRTGEVGDELGSAIITACLIRDLIRLCLLLNRVHPPYSKWLGSAFARLPCAEHLTPVFAGAMTAITWRDREHHLVTAYETVAALHNHTGLTEALDPHTRPFHDRPYQVLHAERFTALTGAVDQFIDSTDVLAHRTRSRLLATALTRRVPQ